MKILNTNNFISERIKVQPITNLELDAAQNKYKLLDGKYLKQGDIVYVKYEQDLPYVVITDKSLYTQILVPQSLKMYDCSCGVLARKHYADDSPSFMLVSDYYNESLKCKGDHDFDIVKLCRGQFKPIKPDEASQFTCIDNLEKLAKNFTVVFENGKWL